MKSFSVGRFPHGLVLVSLLLIGSGFSQPVPAAVVLSPSTSSQPCHGSLEASAAFPTIYLDCTHQLEYLGQYSADGDYTALSPNRRWHNQQASRPTYFGTTGQPLMRPAEVPPFVNLRPAERVVENYAPPAHAVKKIHGQSRLAALRDRVITFAYGREQSLLRPQHLTVDSRGRLLIADPLAGAVHVFDGESSFRIAGGDRRRLQQPNGVAVDADDNIYVADSARGLVDVYDPHGTFIRYIGKIDDESLFDFPTGIAIDRKSGRMYLLDTTRNVLILLDLQGHILKRVGRRTTDEVPVGFSYPTEVAVSDKELMVLDASGSRIQIFDLDGKLLRQFNTFTSTASGIPELRVEMGLAVDGKGNIYLSNIRDSGVRVFTGEGKILNSFGVRGTRAGEFNHPAGVCIQDNKLLVADTDNRRVEVFKIKVPENSSRATLLASSE